MSQTQTLFDAYGGTAAENYERYFVPLIARPLAEDLIEIAGVQPGERVLDIACGTGILARLAAERVGPDGAVTGLDFNPGMLEVARSVAPSDSVIDWNESDAGEMSLPDDSFDVIVSQLGVQFFPDKAGAVREMHRVLRPGGRLVISLTGPTPALSVIGDALTNHISPELGAFIEMGFALHDHDEIRELFGTGGFRNIEVQDASRKLRLEPPREFLWQYVHCTPMAGPISEVDDATRAAFEHDIVQAWQPNVESGNLTITPNIIVVTAGK